MTVEGDRLAEEVRDQYPALARLFGSPSGGEPEPAS
jgi:hypothetical protein